MCEIDWSTGYLSAWCPFCQVYHQHGHGLGNRVAHCDDSPDHPYSPFANYNLTVRAADKKKYMELVKKLDDKVSR